MKDIRDIHDIHYRDEELERSLREVRMQREIAPLDHRIARLRAEIRERLQHLRALKAKGFPEADSQLVLRLVCRTLSVDRQFRQTILRTIMRSKRAHG